jgi:hypothetical protein
MDALSVAELQLVLAIPHVPSSKLHPIVSEITPTDFQILPNARFGSSSRVRMSSMNVIWSREQSVRGGS